MRDPEVQKLLRITDLKDVKKALVCTLKLQDTQQAMLRDRHFVKPANILVRSHGAVKHLEQQKNNVLRQMNSLMSTKPDRLAPYYGYNT